MPIILGRIGWLASTTAIVPPGPDPVVETSVVFDPDRMPTAYILVSAGRGFERTTTSTNYARWLQSIRVLGGGMDPAELGFAGYYWEMELSGSNTSPWNGYIGVVGDGSWDLFNGTTNPIVWNSAGWRGIGELWYSDTGSTARVLSGLPNYTSGDILMFAFNPHSGDLWIGKNGVWVDDPATGDPTWNLIPGLFKISAQGRDPNSNGILNSETIHLNYPVPAGFVSLATPKPLVPDIRPVAVTAYLVAGVAPQDVHVRTLTAYAIIEES